MFVEAYLDKKGVVELRFKSSIPAHRWARLRYITGTVLVPHLA
jgi:hypothetical protein